MMYLFPGAAVEPCLVDWGELFMTLTDLTVAACCVAVAPDLVIERQVLKYVRWSRSGASTWKPSCAVFADRDRKTVTERQRDSDREKERQRDRERQS